MGEQVLETNVPERKTLWGGEKEAFSVIFKANSGTQSRLFSLWFSLRGFLNQRSTQQLSQGSPSITIPGPW